MSADVASLSLIVIIRRASERSEFDSVRPSARRARTRPTRTSALTMLPVQLRSDGLCRTVTPLRRSCTTTETSSARSPTARVMAAVSRACSA